MGLRLRWGKQPQIQGARWRRLDNTGKLFAAVTGEDLSNVFRLSAVLKEEVQPELLHQALKLTLEEYENFRVKLRKGFFWDYFETNNREPLVEPEEGVPCKFIDPHDSRRFPFRVSYYKNRMNLEVFHGLTDGLGALNFMKAMTENYLELALEDEGILTENVQTEHAETDSFKVQEGKTGCRTGEKGDAGNRTEETGEVKIRADEAVKTRTAKNGTARFRAAEKQNESADGYLKNYKKRPAKRYATKKALPVRGACMPLNVQSVIHGTVPLSELKEKSRFYGVSITKYLAAAMLWSVIQIYSDGKKLKRPAALNLPVNLRGIFDTETQSNFFSITNLYWPEGDAPERFEDVLSLLSSQMDQQMAKDRLEETISYNVSNEKKWYVRIIPRAIKHLALDLMFRRSSCSHTMTLSNVGQVVLRPEHQERVKEFQALIGVSNRQRIKCAVITCQGNVMLTFTSVMTDSRLQDYFFRFLEKQGLQVHLESNGAVRPDLDEGNYPRPEYDTGKLKKFSWLFYLVLFTAAALTGVINFATYRMMPVCWSFMTIGAVAYVAMIVRYSIMRKASLAGHLVRHSVGIQVLLIIFDAINGFAGWSVNYVIPSLLLFDDIAIVFLILVNRLNWQSYFMYQIALTFFSFVPILLWMLGLVTRPLLSLVAVVLSVAVLAVTMILGDRSVKDELKRRFHL